MEARIQFALQQLKHVSCKKFQSKFEKMVTNDQFGMAVNLCKNTTSKIINCLIQQNLFKEMEKVAILNFDRLQMSTTTPQRSSKSNRQNQPKDQEPRHEKTNRYRQPMTPKNTFELQNYKNIKEYQPLKKQDRMINWQVKAIYGQMQYKQNHRIQTKHSLYLNAKNPKPPLCWRAQDIVEERQMVLEQKRRESQRLKALREQQEYQRFLAQALPKRTMDKGEIQKLSERLYKQHYSKLNRLNQHMMQRVRQESKVFRQKPQISEHSKDIFHVMKSKEHLQGDVLNRFEMYNVEKAKKQAQIDKIYTEKYCPFKPAINQTSKLLTATKSHRQELSRNKHCRSCVWIKNSKSKQNLTTKPSTPKNQPKSPVSKGRQFNEI